MGCWVLHWLPGCDMSLLTWPALGCVSNSGQGEREADARSETPRMHKVIIWSVGRARGVICGRGVAEHQHTYHADFCVRGRAGSQLQCIRAMLAVTVSLRC